jgi:hypothetical protein
LLLASLIALPSTAHAARPPAPTGQEPCLVWWQAPDHLGETATFCGNPAGMVEQDGFLVLRLGPTWHDLRVGLALELREGCGLMFERLEQAPSLTHVRATGELRETPDGPLLVVNACDQLAVEWQTS